MQSKQSTSGGSGILTILLVVFIVLKLVGVIDWSWWWVLAPFWIPTALLLVFLLVIGLVMLITRRKK